jgi:23S rRNA (uracil1939-C5)-methyltransferase
VELDQLAIASARVNAKNRGAQNGEFISGTSEEALPSLLSRFQAGNTTVILDPPRKGCAPELIETLRRLRPAQIIYVSCHPATMARDLKTLQADDVFNLAQVIPLDMFPQTQHVESVADLRCQRSAETDEV